MTEPEAETSSLLVWTDDYRVRSYEADVSKHLAPASLCDYLQETAGRHAYALGWAGESLHQRGLAWVLARLHVVVGRYPRWGDSLTVTTWPSGALRAYALREFHVADQDGDELAVATTAWLLLDSKSRRPRRPAPEIVEMATRTPPRVLDDAFAPLPAGTVAEHGREHAIAFSEVDVNGHTNNVSLIRCALDATPLDTLTTHQLSELEVAFQAESRAGEVIESRVLPASSEETAFLHRLMLREGGRDVAVAHARWRLRH